MKEPIVPIGMVMQYKFKRKLGEANRIDIKKKIKEKKKGLQENQ